MFTRLNVQYQNSLCPYWVFFFFLHVCVFVVIISAHGSRHAHKHTGAHAASHLHMVKYKRPFKNI